MTKTRWRGRNLSERQERMVVEVKSMEPQRLDHYLWRALAWKSRSRTQEIIRGGRVKVNGEPAKPSRKVRHGDRITIELAAGTGVPDDYARPSFEVLYEDPWLLAVDKPPGLLVHPVGRHVYDTLINYLHHRYRGAGAGAAPAGPDGGEVVPQLCHRIDRDTSGVVLVAKEAFFQREIQAQFSERRVHKEYLALVAGVFPEGVASIDVPIAEGRNLEECLRGPVLRPSRTTVRVVEHPGAYTLLACTPETGRQNQIRVHLAAAGHPLVGDVRYGGAEPPETFPRRFLLHARRLLLYHPRLKSEIELEAPLPADFREVVERLQPPGGNDRAGKDRGGGAGAAPPAAGEGPFPPTV